MWMRCVSNVTFIRGNGFAVIAGTASPTVQLHHRLRRGSKDDGEQEQDSGANQRRNGAAKSAFLQG